MVLSSRDCRHMVPNADVFGYPGRVSEDPSSRRTVEIFRHRDAARAGLTRGRLRGLVKRSEVERVGRGLYRRISEPSELDTVATVCARVPAGIVCLLTALAVHGIGTQAPQEVWIALDRKARKPRLADLPVRVVRFSGPMLSCGIEERRVHGVVVRMTTVERTVVDCFRYRNKIGLDVALEALKDALRTRRVTVGGLVRTARTCRAETVLRPYLEASVA